MSSSEGRGKRAEREERREKREERREQTDPKRAPEVLKSGLQRGTDPFLHRPARKSEVDRRLESLHFKGGS